MRVVITGANRGIGAELVRRYQERGDEVIGTSRKAAPRLDVSDPASVRAFAETQKDLPIDLLICNAGVYVDKGHDLISGYEPRLWGETFATNVTGVFLTIQALLTNLQAAKGKIAIMSSQMASSERAPGGSYIYRASKAAALNLGRNLAADMKADGVAVGIYHPGWVQTDMGGTGAAISVDEAGQGLVERFDALSLATTGCFETWDGNAHPF